MGDLHTRILATALKIWVLAGLLVASGVCSILLGAGELGIFLCGASLGLAATVWIIADRVNWWLLEQIHRMDQVGNEPIR